mgnify:CR=1 FL=1
MSAQEEYYSYEGPICPNCKTQFTADDPYFYDESGYTEDTCQYCGVTFKVEVSISTTWTTTLK